MMHLANVYGKLTVTENLSPNVVEIHEHLEEKMGKGFQWIDQICFNGDGYVINFAGQGRIDHLESHIREVIEYFAEKGSKVNGKIAVNHEETEATCVVAVTENELEIIEY